MFASEGRAPAGVEAEVHARAMSLAADADLVEVASAPIAMHRMRAGAGPAGWDPAVPLVGWAFPAFLGGALAYLVTALLDGGGEDLPAGPGSPVGEALHAAVSMACHAPGRAVIRLVETGFGPSAFWVDWGNDTFVMTDSGAVVAGPEFASMARDAAGDAQGRSAPP
jgi:hypothetical protein